MADATVVSVAARGNAHAISPVLPGLPVGYGVRSVSTTSGTGTSFTLGIPAGATATDSVFVCLIHSNDVQLEAANPLQGWTVISSAFQTFITVRVLQSAVLATTGPWTFNFLRAGVSFSDTYVAAAVCVQADTTVIGARRPIVDTAVSKIVAPTTASFAFPAITPTNTGELMLWLAGWRRYTTFTPPADVTEQVELSSGTGSSDMTLWVGSQTGATTAGLSIGAITVANDNPSSYAADGQAMITSAFMSIPPPTSWVGDFETGDFSQYAFVLGADPNRITIQTDTPRQGTRYARFFALDEDVYPLTPTENPRASLVSPRILYPGFERWISWSTRFPVDFPSIPHNGWLVFWQYHGPPYTGSPSVGFGVDENDRINVERNQTYDYDTIWSAPMPRGQWIDFVLHVNLAQDETGFIELWVNGRQQVFARGVRKLYMRTVELDQNGGLEIDPSLYRKHGMFETATLDYDAVLLGSTVPSSIAGSIQIAPPVLMFGDRLSPSAIAKVVS